MNMTKSLCDTIRTSTGHFIIRIMHRSEFCFAVVKQVWTRFKLVSSQYYGPYAIRMNQYRVSPLYRFRILWINIPKAFSYFSQFVLNETRPIHVGSYNRLDSNMDHTREASFARNQYLHTNIIRMISNFIEWKSQPIQMASAIDCAHIYACVYPNTQIMFPIFDFFENV